MPFFILIKGLVFIFGWDYDNDVLKITALTAAAACKVSNGRTFHSEACL